MVAADGLGLGASVTVLGFFYTDGIYMLLYVDNMMLMTESDAQSTSEDRLKALCDLFYARFKAKGSIVGEEFQYLGQSIKLDRKHGKVTVTPLRG